MSLFSTIISDLEALFGLAKAVPTQAIAEAPGIVARVDTLLQAGEHDIATVEGVANAAVATVKQVLSSNGLQVADTVVQDVVSGVTKIVTAGTAKAVEQTAGATAIDHANPAPAASPAAAS